MKLSDIGWFDAMIPPLDATDRDSAIAEMVDALAQAGKLGKAKAKQIIEAVVSRENEASTGIGKGVAVPHVKHKALPDVVAAIGCTDSGIDFSALDKQPVYSVILLLSSPENADEHLQAMETIFKHVQRDMFRKFLRQSETKQAIVDLIQEADELG